MKKMKRIVSAVLACACAFSLFTGCGGKETTADQGNQGSQTGQTGGSTETTDELKGDIVFWHSFTQGPRMEKIQAAADEFMELHPGVNITIETFSWADFLYQVDHGSCLWQCTGHQQYGCDTAGGND